MRSVVIYGALLTVAMIGAYISWTSDEQLVSESSDDGVAVYSAREGDVSALAFDGEKLDVKVERKSDARGEYLWVTVDERKEKRPPPKPHGHDHDGGEDDHDEDDHGDEEDGDEGTPDDAPLGPEEVPPEPEPEPEPEFEEIHKEFLGNDRAAGLMETFEPLMALRELRPQGDDLSAFELDSPEARLVVTRSGGELVLNLGGETYGSRDRYARYDGKVLLLDDTTVRPLQFAATRLKEIRLHPFTRADLVGATVSSAGQTLELVQKNKDDAQAAFWARADDPGDRDDEVGTWLDKVLKLKVRDYAEPSDAEAASERFAITLRSGAESWTFAVLEDPDGKRVFARSDFNRSLVELPPSLGADALADLESLFAE